MGALVCITYAAILSLASEVTLCTHINVVIHAKET